MEFINELSRCCHRKSTTKIGLPVTHKSSAKTRSLVTQKSLAKTNSQVTQKSSAKTTFTADAWNRQ
jgi:hypothetical protein